MEALLSYVLESLIGNTNFTIEDQSDDMATRFNVKLSEEDYPRVIGKKGMTIKALTDILKLSYAQQQTAGQPRGEEEADSIEMKKVFINVTHE